MLSKYCSIFLCDPFIAFHMNLPTYLLEGGSSGRERLRLLARTMAPLTSPFLASLNIQQGNSCVDIGCGGGDVTRQLAGIVGETGIVTGIDADADILKIAEEETMPDTTAGTITWLCADATQYTLEQPVDVSYARFVLTHIPDVENFLRHIISQTKPGGIVAVEDVWFPGHFCNPANSAFETYVQWYELAALHKRGHPRIGIQLPEMFDACGLQNISFTLVTQSFRTGDEKGLTLITLDKMKQAVLDSGAATEEEFTVVRDELRAYTFRTDTLLSMAPVMQIRGQRPL